MSVRLVFGRSRVIDLIVALFISFITYPKFIPRGGDSHLAAAQFFAACFIIVGVLFVKYRLSSWSAPRLVLYLFCVYCFSGVIWSIDPFVTLYSSFLLLAIVVIADDLSGENVNSGFGNFVVSASLALSLYGILFYISEGVGIGRYVGDITPNHYSGILVSSFIIGYVFSKNKKMIIFLFLAAFFGAFVVESRGSMLQLFIIASTHFYIFSPRKISRIKLVIYFSLMVILALTLLFSLEFIAEEILKVNDKDRGLGSGGTGRMDYIRSALPYYFDSPIFGSGFSTANSDLIKNSHNGYLNALIELGVVGMGIYLLSVGLSLKNALVDRSNFVSRKAAIAMMSILVLATFEVHMLNVGFIMGFVFVFLWSYVSCRGASR